MNTLQKRPVVMNKVVVQKMSKTTNTNFLQRKLPNYLSTVKVRLKILYFRCCLQRVCVWVVRYELSVTMLQREKEMGRVYNWANN